ncbi:O-antigen export system permease protein RfbD [hydrothermal vent metagenome]|uniref:O-antigen export system permease protein RfbD n=1 Tax=hydrothermal vent metagenome TaxID=652676 RepID=A0A3B1E6H7_9ZZZZ
MIKYILKNSLTDYKNSYKSSFLSYSWVILHPLMLLGVYSFVFSQIMQSRVDVSGNISYTVYLAVGILPWIVFSTAILQGTLGIVNNVNFIKKLNIPIYVYVAKEVVEQFLNMIVAMTILFVFLYLNDITPTLKWLLVFVPIVLLFIFSLGISMFLSSINIFFRDIEKAIGIFLQILMWMIPIVYPLDIVPKDWNFVIFYDPIFYYFNSIRELIIFDHSLSIKYYMIMIISSIVMFLIGFYTINKLESDIRDSI